jgi:transcriptional regulator with XRE-family HTH domain
MTILSNNIKYLRRVAGLTQVQFANKISASRAAVGSYEEARATPPLDLLKRIANYFNVSVDSLVKTDIRRIKNTPLLVNPNGPPPMPPSPLNVPDARDDRSAQAVQTVVEKYYKQPSAPDFPAIYEQSPGPPPPSLVPTSTVNSFNEIPALSPNIEGNLDIPWVSQILLKEYLLKYHLGQFVQSLPTLRLPFWGTGTFRAFEVGDDFPMKHSIVIAEKLDDIQKIRNGQYYILIVKQLGLLYRRVYSEVQTKGMLVVLSDTTGIPSMDLPIKEVIEYWEVKGFFSQELPKPKMSLELVRELVGDLSREINRLGNS